VAVDHRALIESIADVHNRRDWDGLGRIFADDCIEEYPQSGEVIRGLMNVRAVRENYPGQLPDGGIDLSSARIAVSDERWIVTPMFTVVRVQDSGNVGTAMFRIRYPDGSTWWNVILYEMRAGKVARSTAFFAPLFDAPEWRVPYVEQQV